MVMISGLKTREALPLTIAAASDTKEILPGAIPARLGAYAATLRTRRGQSVALSFEGSEAAFVVRSGALMLHVTLPGGLRQVIALYYPGDVFRTAFAPPAASAHLSAVTAGEVLRFRWSAVAELAADDPETAGYFADAVAKQTARQAIHMAAVGQFDCQQRVATYLMELAMGTGVRAPSGAVAFEMPLRRTDMADYLGLNADTLSRTMSRLRASGLLSHPDRHHAIIRDLDALAALTPAAQSIRALYAKTPSTTR